MTYSWDTANLVVGYPRNRTEATAMAEAVRLHSEHSNYKWRAVKATLRTEGVPRRRGHVRPAQPTGKFWIVPTRSGAMKLPDDWWVVNDDDAEQGWAGFIAAAATLVIVLVAGYLWMVTFAAAQ